MDTVNGFSLLRGLGEMPNGDMISQQALTAIHWVHRNVAIIVFAYMGTLAWRLRAFAGLRGPATLVLVFLLAQLATGLTTIFFQWPLLVAVLHNGGAAALVLPSQRCPPSAQPGAAEPIHALAPLTGCVHSTLPPPKQTLPALLIFPLARCTAAPGRPPGLSLPRAHCSALPPSLVLFVPCCC